MMDELDRQIASAVSEITTPTGVERISPAVMGRVRPRRSRIASLAPLAAVTVIATVAVAVGLQLVRTPAPAGELPVGAASAAPALAVDAAGVAQCHAGLGPEDVEAVVSVASEADVARAFPAADATIPELANTPGPGVAFVLKDRFPEAALRLNPPPEGTTWPPFEPLKPEYRDVCLVLPPDPSIKGVDARPTVMVVTIDVTGMKP